MLMPPPSPARDETQDDSGFHSGGMSSSTSTEHDQMQGGKTKKKSIMKSSKGTKRSESQPGRMNRCESIDLKEKQKGSSDHQFRTRSKLISEQTAHYGGHYPHMAPHAIYAVHPQVGFDQSHPHESDSNPGSPCRPHLGGARSAATWSCGQERQLLDGRLHHHLFILTYHSSSSGGQELPEQACQFAFLGWVKQAAAAATDSECLREEQQPAATQRGARTSILPVINKPPPLCHLLSKPSTADPPNCA